MTEPRNGYTAGRLATGGPGPVQDMAAYDRLPTRLRGLVAEMPINVVAASVEAVLAVTGEEQVALLLLVVREKQVTECRRLAEEACAL